MEGDDVEGDVPDSLTMPAPRVQLIGKPGCHLCDDARLVVESVTAELGETYAERSILDDADLHERFWERIPVVLVDGVVSDYWRVDPDRLRAALTAEPPRLG